MICRRPREHHDPMEKKQLETRDLIVRRAPCSGPS
jgi:hypothetical protein